MQSLAAFAKKYRWFLIAAVVVVRLVILSLYVLGFQYGLGIQPLLDVMLIASLAAIAWLDVAKGFVLSLRENPGYQAKWIVFIVSSFVLTLTWQLHTYFSTADSWMKKEPSSYFFVALTGLATTFFGLVVYDVFLEPIRRLLEGTEREEFLDLFGRSCKENGITLVHARRVLDRGRLKRDLDKTAIGCEENLRKSVEKIVNAFSDYPFAFQGKLPDAAKQTHPEGVTSWVAYQDVQSAAHLAQLLARVRIDRQIKFELDIDRAEQGWDICQVSFGLGFNVMTDLVQKQFDSRARGGQPPIQALPFEVDYTQASLARGREVDDEPNSTARKDSQFKTDNIKWQGQLLKPNAGRDYAIIVRVVHGNPDYATFVCAGRTACGTTAAGMYLAEHWKDTLWKEYSMRKDEVVDGRKVAFHTHSLFAIVEHATGIPHKGKIAIAPWDKEKKERLIHFEVSSLTP
jgi:hypothetical protein